MKKIFIFLIDVYQKTISPDHGIFKRFFPAGYCKYSPTCSDYGKEAIDTHGIFKGSIMASYRILRCNPFSKGGYDPVPPLKK